MEIIKLNLGRNCLKYIIKAYNIKEIHVPYYCCNTVWKAIVQENCRMKFYHIDDNFMPIKEFRKKDFILYINYFGLNDQNCQKLAYKYPNLIIDNTQSFYSEHIGLASFNSLRKFFKVSNGAYLYVDKFLNDKFESDNIQTEPIFIQDNYQKFVQNEVLLNENNNIKMISQNTIDIMKNIDTETDKKQRVNLFKKYDKIFGGYNIIRLPNLEDQIPYCYPFSTNNTEIKKILEKFILLHLWNELPKDFSEYKMLNNVAALPLNDTIYAKKIISQFARYR